MSTTNQTASASTTDNAVTEPKKFIITTLIYVKAEDEDAAEAMLNSALDNLSNNGGDVWGHEILETREDTSED